MAKKVYTLDAIKYGSDPDFWRWFYFDYYKSFYMSLDPKRCLEDYVENLQGLLNSFDTFNKNDEQYGTNGYTKERLLVQMDVLSEVIKTLKHQR